MARPATAPPQHARNPTLQACIVGQLPCAIDADAQGSLLAVFVTCRRAGCAICHAKSADSHQPP